MDNRQAEDIRRKVRTDYDYIAERFAETRTSLWQEFEYFRPYLRSGATILDVGCGPGRLIKLFEGLPVQYTGIDNSAKLLEKAQQYAGRFPNVASSFKLAEMTELSYPADHFDFVFCIATLHHLPTRTLQLQSLREMARVLKPGGRLFMTNWYLLGQPRYLFLQLKQRITQRSLYAGASWRDFFIPWKATHPTVYRYYYAFSAGELVRLVEAAGLTLDRQQPASGTKDWSGKFPKRNFITIAQKA